MKPITKQQKIHIFTNAARAVRGDSYTFGQRLLVLSDLATALGGRLSFDASGFYLHASGHHMARVIAHVPA